MIRERFETIFHMRISVDVWKMMLAVRNSRVVGNLFRDDNDFIMYFSLFGLRGVEKLYSIHTRVLNLLNLEY